MRSFSSGETRATTMPSRSSSAPSTCVVVGELVAGQHEPVRRSAGRPRSAIAAAVAGWSPVIMATLMPARRHAGDGLGDVRSGRVLQAEEPAEAQVGLGFRRRRREVCSRLEGRPATARTRSPSSGQRRRARRRPVGDHAAQGEDGVGRTLDHHLAADDHRHAAPARVEREASLGDIAGAVDTRCRARAAGRTRRARPPSGRRGRATRRRPRGRSPSSSARRRSPAARGRPGRPGRTAPPARPGQ